MAKFTGRKKNIAIAFYVLSVIILVSEITGIVLTCNI